MAKGSGGTRVVKPHNGTFEQARRKYLNALSDSRYVPSRSYLSPSGGSLLFEKGHNVVKEEIEAGRLMADKGYEVVLTPEGGTDTIRKVTKRGSEKFPDGTIDFISYEQKTPNPAKTDATSRAKNVNNALEHAMKKGADVAFIYDKHGVLHREDIDSGIHIFENRMPYRFKAILTLNAHGDVHEWYHDK
nr:MAG TPA: hypothetical protein [Caudoviricetes sp.]